MYWVSKASLEYHGTAFIYNGVRRENRGNNPRLILPPAVSTRSRPRSRLQTPSWRLILLTM